MNGRIELKENMEREIGREKIRGQISKKRRWNVLKEGKAGSGPKNRIKGEEGTMKGE